MFMILIILGLMFVAGCMNGIMDTIKHRWHNSIFYDTPKHGSYLWEYFHINGWKHSYEYGWVMGDYSKKKPWYVWRGILDGWHGAKSIMLWCTSTAIGLTILTTEKTYIYVIFIIFASRLLFGIGFNLMYNIVLTKRN